MDELEDDVRNIREALQELHSESPSELRSAYDEIKEYIDQLIGEL